MNSQWQHIAHVLENMTTTINIPNQEMLRLSMTQQETIQSITNSDPVTVKIHKKSNILMDKSGHREMDIIFALEIIQLHIDGKQILQLATKNISNQ